MRLLLLLAAIVVKVPALKGQHSWTEINACKHPVHGFPDPSSLPSTELVCSYPAWITGLRVDVSPGWGSVQDVEAGCNTQLNVTNVWTQAR